MRVRAPNLCPDLAGGRRIFLLRKQGFSDIPPYKSAELSAFPAFDTWKKLFPAFNAAYKKKGGAFTTHCFPYLWGKTEIMVVVFRVDKRSIGAVKQRKGRMQLYQRHLSYAFAIEGIPFCSNRIEMAKGGCSKEQPPFLTNETEKGRGVICSRP